MVGGLFIVVRGGWEEVRVGEAPPSWWLEERSVMLYKVEVSLCFLVFTLSVGAAPLFLFPDDDAVGAQ